jgi:hypothetical protein
MGPGSALALLAISGLVFWLILRRATELFCVHVRDGAVRHVRGRIPPSLFSDLCDVLAAPRVANAVVRAVTRGGEPRLLVEGELGADQLQRLRNVLGRFKTAQIRSGRRPRAGSAFASRR